MQLLDSLLDEVRKQKPELADLNNEDLIKAIKGIKTTKKDAEKWLSQ